MIGLQCVFSAPLCPPAHTARTARTCHSYTWHATVFKPRCLTMVCTVLRAALLVNSGLPR